MAKCLLCGAGVWYVGLVSADCENSGCANYREPPRKKREREYGTWAWARRRQKTGWKLEWTVNGVWEELTERLDLEPEHEHCRYRIDQRWYAPPSEFCRGTSMWAKDMQDKGCDVHFNGKEYEVIPSC